jgi:carbonic anhydrase
MNCCSFYERSFKNPRPYSIVNQQQKQKNSKRRNTPMQRKILVVLSLITLIFTSSISIASEVGSSVSPDQALQYLLEGNRGFANDGDVDHLKKMSKPYVRRDLALNGQKPYAIILTCSDSRVPPEILFDKGLGEIFVVRVAGNIVAPHELGSIEYGVEHLGAKLIMVLGHTKCGAVTSTYNAYPAQVEGNIGSLIESISPAVASVVGNNPKPTDPAAQTEQIAECIVENVKKVSESLEVKSPVLKEFAEKGEIKIVRALYDIESGKVNLMSSEEHH